MESGRQESVQRRPGDVGFDSLEVFDFGLLLQALAQSLKVGTLRVHSAQGEKYISFDRGRVKAIYTEKSRIRIGHILYNMRVLSKVNLRRAIAEKSARRDDPLLGVLLVQKGMITVEQLRAAVLYQMTEELLEVFYWKDYSYEFFSGPMESSLPRVFNEYIRVGGDQEVRDLLQNASRIIEDVEKFNRYTPSLRDIYEVITDPEEYLLVRGRPRPLEELLKLLDGCRDVREILRDMRMNRFEAMGLLCQMCVDGLIRPKNALELLMLGENQRASLPPDKLVRIYERTREVGVEGFDVSLRLAEVYVSLERMDDAAQSYGEHARGTHQAGDLEGALASARRAVELQPELMRHRRFLLDLLEEQGGDELADVLSELAQMKRAKGLTTQAEELISRALEVRSSDPVLLQTHIELCAALGRSHEAGSQLYRLARVWERIGNLAEAEGALREAVSLLPADIRIQNALVRVLLGMGDTAKAEAEAITLLTKLTEHCDAKDRHPFRSLLALMRRLEADQLTGPEVSGKMAAALAEAGETSAAQDLLLRTAERELTACNFKRACQLLGQGVDLAPEETRLREDLTKALECLGNIDSALQHLRRLATTFEHQEQPQEAERIYKKMLKLNPISPDTLERLADLTAREGRTVEAASLLARVGDLNRAAGIKKLAIEFYDRACRLDPTKPSYLRRLADMLAETLETPRSTQSFEQLVELLKERGEHAAALEAGIKVLDLCGGAEAEKLIPILVAITELVP
jgi:tetratricopeptide (TPR) repeat protein